MKEIVQDEIKEDVSKMLNEIQALKDDKEKEMEQVYARFFFSLYLFLSRHRKIYILEYELP